MRQAMDFTRFGFADTPLPVGWGWLAGFS